MDRGEPGYAPPTPWRRCSQRAPCRQASGLGLSLSDRNRDGSRHSTGMSVASSAAAPADPAARMSGVLSSVVKKSPRGWITFALLALVGGAVVVAWQVPIPKKIPTVAWNSAWVFRAEVFAGFFVGVYVVLAITATTIRTGRPPRKLSFGMFSYEEAEVEKTADALNEGQAALQAVQREVDGLRDRLARTASSARAAHEGVLALAGDAAEVRGRAQREIAALQEQEENVRTRDPEFDRAMGKLEQRLRELDAMLERPRRVLNGG